MGQQIAGTLLAIVLVDLALSGDNAFVIGAVASKLRPPQRNQAIALGSVMAVVLRIALTAGAVFLLHFSFVQAAGGAVVFIIALQLVRDTDEAEIAGEESKGKKPRGAGLLADETGLGRATVAIFIANLSMSLDNVLAIAALANGNYILLTIGLLISIIPLLVASAFIARLIARYPWLLYAAGGILAWTAGSMILNDSGLHPMIVRLDQQVPGPSLQLLVSPALLVLYAIIVTIIFALDRRQRPTITRSAKS